jgi:hypothetical protein
VTSAVSRARASWSATSGSIHGRASRDRDRRPTGGSQSRGRCGPATPSSRRAGPWCASRVRCTPFYQRIRIRRTRSQSSPWRASSPACSGACSPVSRTMPTRSPRRPEEAAPARDPRRRTDAEGHPDRDLGDEAEDESCRAPARGASRGRLPAERHRLAAHAGEEKRAPARHRGAHLVGRQAPSTAGPSPRACSLARRQDRRPF